MIAVPFGAGPVLATDCDPNSSSYDAGEDHATAKDFHTFGGYFNDGCSNGNLPSGDSSDFYTFSDAALGFGCPFEIVDVVVDPASTLDVRVNLYRDGNDGLGWYLIVQSDDGGAGATDSLSSTEASTTHYAKTVAESPNRTTWYVAVFREGSTSGSYSIDIAYDCYLL